MSRGPTRQVARYVSYCKYCGNEFRAKRKSTIVCNSNDCQRRYHCSKNSKRYLREIKKKAEKSGNVTDEIQYLKGCIRHEMLHHDGEPDQEKVVELEKQLKDLYESS